MPTASVNPPQPASISPTLPPQQAAPYFPALDGLRAIAFLMVFAEHYLQMPWGWAGVDVFFVLSGFLITGILFDTQNDQHRARTFYMRRTLRIFPLYYGLILVLLLLNPRYHWAWNWSWLAWPLYLGNFARFLYAATPTSPIRLMADGHLISATHTQLSLHFGHFWSLCVEEQFYLVWPWLVFWIKDRRRLIYLCAAAVVVCPLLRILASHSLPQYMLAAEVCYRATPLRVDALLLGGVVALIHRGAHTRAMLLAARAGFAILATVALLWFVHGVHARYLTGVYVYPGWRFTWGLTILDLTAASILVMALQPGSLAYRVLHLRPLRQLGRISYGAYVFHDILHDRFYQVALLVNQRLHLPLPWLKSETAALAFVCTLVLAWASFRWFETPFIRLKDSWSRTPAKQPVAPAVPVSPSLTPLRNIA